MATENAYKSTHDQIAILDFGSQYSHIIARRVRELGVYCELHSCLVSSSVLEAAPLKGIILSGGPFSVYEDGAPHMQVGNGEMEKRPCMAPGEIRAFLSFDLTPNPFFPSPALPAIPRQSFAHACTNRRPPSGSSRRRGSFPSSASATASRRWST